MTFRPPDGGSYPHLGTYCSWCGKPEPEADHTYCQKRLALIDPPRFCPQCARRMVVQVTPAGWTARCSRHGESTSAPATS